MKDFEALSAAYFRDFESYRVNVGLFNWRTIVLITSFVFFVYGSLSWIESQSTLMLVASEFVLFGSWVWIRKYQHQQVLARLNKRWKTDFSKINRAQKEWLSRSIDVPTTEYFNIACNISDSYDLKKKHRIDYRLEWSDVFRLAYDPDSKARVLSLAIFLLSLVSLLIIKTYEHDHMPVEILLAEGFSQYLGTLLFLCLIFWLFLIGVRICFEFLTFLIFGILDGISKGNTSSNRARNRLIQILLDNHEIPKLRYKAVES